MLDKLKPDLYYNNIFDIDFNKLKGEGIKGIICDIDNTIVAWSKQEVVQEVEDWFIMLNHTGFEICLVSNAKDDRVEYFSNRLGLPAIGQAVKPARKSFEKAQEIIGLKRKEIAVIGDQIFTDVLGGNRMGYRTILVNPMSEKEFIATRCMRLIEKIFFKRREET